MTWILIYWIFVAGGYNTTSPAIATGSVVFHTLKECSDAANLIKKVAAKDEFVKAECASDGEDHTPVMEQVYCQDDHMWHLCTEEERKGIK